MCLAIPGEILEAVERKCVRYGRVNFGGVIREVCLDFIPEARVGDYVIVHVGFAISRVDADEARRTYELLKQMGVLEGELNSEMAGDDVLAELRQAKRAGEAQQ
jgi:hydrogenase expression/formation protein HypC